MAHHEKKYVPIYAQLGGNDKEVLLSAITKLVKEAQEYESPLYINLFAGAPPQPPPTPPGGGNG